MLQTFIWVELLFPAFIELRSKRFQVETNTVGGRAAAVAAVAGEKAEGSDDADDGATPHGDADDLRCGVA